ncbi:hypothetical protein ACIOHB_15760 [Streptomyces microflavus]|uniref:Uncharacterized protein n=1 Tax=Streptomyces microflavus DSM 40593 TaxID=1303692 RepID=N0CUJ0_STRMI|nr:MULTISPECIES: hypothetical protein [Streptomyces]AGK79365.1 hypothetical protein SFUL_4469 [Streptomyces microflavus DSM 40593]MCX4654515.1 hypothetical protein [Streptomyces microflavus]GGX89615.1 hypothetical protein GCM10010298_63910 [Streptomyces microflavus]SCK23335.1 hypothetical protein YUYDRAFT_02497 [Streptomyces sp. ScaeMP-e48]
MTSPYPPGWPEGHTYEGIVKDVVAGLLSSGGDFTRTVKNLVLDTVTGEALEKIAVALGADPAADSINASSQTLYWSTQSFKFDPTLVTFAPDAVQITPKGIEIFGVNVTPGWEAKFERLIDWLTPWNIQAPDQTSGAGADVERGLKNTNIRVNGLEQRVGALRRIPATVGRHDTVLRGLTRNQRHMAASGATDTIRRSGAETRQANQLSGQRNQGANVRVHTFNANQLRETAQGLRRVEEEAARLERRLG